MGAPLITNHQSTFQFIEWVIEQQEAKKERKAMKPINKWNEAIAWAWFHGLIERNWRAEWFEFYFNERTERIELKYIIAVRQRTKSIIEWNEIIDEWAAPTQPKVMTFEWSWRWRKDKLKKKVNLFAFFEELGWPSSAWRLAAAVSFAACAFVGYGPHSAQASKQALPLINFSIKQHFNLIHKTNLIVFIFSF